ELVLTGISPEFIERARELVPDWDFNQIVEAGAAGADPALVAQLREAVPQLSFHEAVEMAVSGVTADQFKLAMSVISLKKEKPD
ncbi:MAG: hypothetical protein KY429_11965, partial [Actinobacteria bacterium]|nr:hypothetical protein [Actinomycetota bacterium]